MTSRRPYAPALAPDEALAELERCAGAQFDPAVVDAFGAVWNEAVADENRSHAATSSELAS